MKRTFTVLIFVLFATLMVAPTLAQTDTIYGLVTVDNAAVRVGPDFAYDAIDVLPRDTSVRIIGRAGDFRYRWDGKQWLQIDYGGQPAWMYARLLRTSTAFNSIPVRGMLLPRNRNGRVPDTFDLSSDVCSQWVGGFSQSGDFGAGDATMTFSYPALQGATEYRLILIDSLGFRSRFITSETQITIDVLDMKLGEDTYTWRVAPYWQQDPNRGYPQQVCPLQTGGTFYKPEREPITGG